MNVIKEIPESQFDEFVRIMADAYPGMKLVTDKDREKYKERMIKQNGYFDR